MQSSDNVVSLASAHAARAGSGRKVKPESVAVINDCRDIAVKRITALLAKTFDTIQDELFDLAEKSHDRDKQNFYLDARAQAREKRAAIEASFRKQFLSFFEKKVSGDDDAVRAPSDDYSALSLVEDKELEEKLAMNNIAARLSSSCDEELSALSQRMGWLLSVPEMKEHANPMSPDTVVKALRSACDQMASGYEAKLAVMKLAEQHMAREMLGVYHDINALLIGRHVLPQIRPAFNRAQGSNPRKTHAANPQTPRSAVPDATANPAADIFTTLQQLLAGGQLFDTNLSAGTAAPPAYGVTTGSFAPVPPQSGAGITTEQEMANIAGGSVPSVSSSGLVSALSHIQLQPPGSAWNADANHAGGNSSIPAMAIGQPNAVREVKASGIANGSSQVDAMTIDIVAMLFDYVFEDKNIPDAIKALLARMQIPVLKVAILDKSFFSRKHHPARRLLDVMADASVCFADGATHDDPLYKKVREVVDCIQTEFDTDIQLFSQMLAEFEQFRLERETVNADMVEQSARAFHEREKRELARLIAQDETGRRINVPELPPPVAAMLTGPWSRVLERVYLREGGRNSGFAAALETVDNLIWSVAPKTDADQRKRMVGLLPVLLAQLREGMQIAAVEESESARFFEVLVDCHAAAVRAGMRGESVASLFLASQTTAEIAPLFARLIAEETAQQVAMKKEAAARAGMARIQFTDQGVEIEEFAATKSNDGQIEERSIDVDSRKDDIEVNDGSTTPFVELARGTWVEFTRSSGEKIRAKLSWISPLKGVYLFTNPGAAGALSVTPEVLQRQFRRGIARTIPESSLVDRAVDNIVNSLSGAMSG